jgi:regulator of protease activity HflC (stomatin/prohibitin superfamily)
MKKVFVLSVVALLSLSSCYEFSREQKFKDAENDGKSVLIEAQSSRKALIETAKAENESATLKAEAMIKIAKAQASAEVERAKGVAAANKIIGNSLQGNSEYLKYLQIEAIKYSKGSKVYIPTEAGLPILEAK